MARCVVCEKEMGFADKVNAKSFDGLCRSCTDHGRKIAADGRKFRECKKCKADLGTISKAK